MATGSIPFPSSGITSGAQPPSATAVGITGSKLGAGATIPGSPATVGTNPTATNPFIPPTSTTSGAGGTIPAGGQPPSGTSASNPVTAGSTTGGALANQENDIFGAGVGGELTNLLQSLSGVDSAALQNYIKSLQPQEANAQATVNATLGAQGVSGNSSVAAIADSNLQAQETAAIAGESAQLQTQEENLEAGILTGQENLAAQEVAGPGLAIFGDILGAAGNVAGAYVKGH